MRIKDCVLKTLRGESWLHHTASGYKVRLNMEGAAVLKSMAQRLSPEEMTGREKYIYDRLAAKGIAGPDSGTQADRLIPVKDASPLQTLELEFSGRCNLRCAHCFSALSLRDMNQETLDLVFGGIDALQPVNLVLTGGEPLLNPLLPRALEMAAARLLRTVITTNGTLVDRETAALLKARGVAKAVVSLDFFKETHDAIRGDGSFEQAVRGIRLLAAAKVPVFVTAMVQESTAARIEEFKRFCMEELGAAGLRLSSVMPIGRGKGSPELSLPPALVKALFDKGEISAADGGDAVFERLADERTFDCGAGVSECFVSAAGKVYACHYFQNLGESMGDMAERPLANIYRDYPASGAMPAAFDWAKLSECRACARFSACRGGCRARARLLAGGWYAPDGYSCAMYGKK